MVFNLSESVPATVCRFSICQWTGCPDSFALQIRNRRMVYTSEGTCNAENFCMRRSGSSVGDLTLSYEGVSRRIGVNEWRNGNIDEWCRVRNGRVVWFDFPQ